MIIKVIAVSKIKEKYILEGIKEYTKRLSSYCSIIIKEVDAEKIKSSLTIDKIKDLEAEKIRAFISKDSFIVALDETGKQFNNLKLAEYFTNNIINSGISEINFIIGGANGLSKEIIDKSNLTLSLSKLTFPHQLARLILIEQIYRTFKILKNEPYHK